MIVPKQAFSVAAIPAKAGGKYTLAGVQLESQGEKVSATTTDGVMMLSAEWAAVPPPLGLEQLAANNGAERCLIPLEVWKKLALATGLGTFAFVSANGERAWGSGLAKRGLKDTTSVEGQCSPNVFPAHWRGVIPTYTSISQEKDGTITYGEVEKDVVSSGLAVTVVVDAVKLSTLLAAMVQKGESKGELVELTVPLKRGAAVLFHTFGGVVSKVRYTGVLMSVSKE